MPFDFTGFAIMSLLMAVISIRTIYQTIRDRKTLFDHRFTQADRQHMSVAAFFILIPISVLLHEVGHAVAVWWFGGDVVAFGFFFFFGFVGYEGVPDVSDRFWIALWGNIVSIALGIGAILLAFLRPMRAAFNYPLIMFGIISILISLVFYPAMDLLSDLHGDWSQIYSEDTPVLATGMGIVHGLILLGAIIAWQTERVRLRFAEITDLKPEEMRKVRKAQAEREILQAAEDAAAAFQGLARAEAGGSSREAVSAYITWTSGGFNRTVVVIGSIQRQLRVEILGMIRTLDGSNVIAERRIARVRGFPEPENLQPQVLKALNTVENWRIEHSEADPTNE